MLNKRQNRKATLTLESLDDRIVPSAMNSHLGAQLQARLALRHEQQMHMREARLHAGLGAQAGARAASMAQRHQFAFGMHANPTANLHWGAANRQSVRLPIGMGRAIPRFANPVASNFTGGSVSIPGPTHSSSPPKTSVAPPNSGGSPTTSAEHTLPSNVDQNLDKIYQEFLDSGSSDSFTSSEAAFVVIDGANVGIVAHGNGTGSFDAYVAALTSLGMNVTSTDAKTFNVSGMIPISALPDAADLGQTFSLSPMYRPRTM